MYLQNPSDTTFSHPRPAHTKYLTNPIYDDFEWLHFFFRDYTKKPTKQQQQKIHLKYVTRR